MEARQRFYLRYFHLHILLIIINWQKVQIFWGDERCVPPEDEESNYGITKNLLLDKITIPKENIHRIKGADIPENEARRYASEIKTFVPVEGGLPRFDIILLGLGEDGHTASLFPRKELSAIAQNICGVAVKPHPAGSEGQKRISLTKDTICNAEKIFFLVTGNKKAKILSEIINDAPVSENYPASEIKNI